MTTKALSYLRVSGKSQVDGDGFPRQRKAVADYAKLNGFELAEEFRDEGVSGTKELADRKGLAAAGSRRIERSQGCAGRACRPRSTRSNGI